MVRMVFDVLEERLTLLTSASVPVFTDQRSTPQLWARRSGGAREAISRNAKADTTRRTLTFIVPPGKEKQESADDRERLLLEAVRQAGKMSLDRGEIKEN